MEEELWGGIRMQWSGRQFRLSTDSMLLSDFAVFAPNARICDLGCGSGAISLLLLGKYPKAELTGIELQPDAAEAAMQNVLLNGLESRCRILCGDLRAHRELLKAGSFDAVISNPPYFPLGRGEASEKPELAAARSEQTCTLADVCACAAWLLRFGGKFAIVHKPERLADLIWELRQHRLEPKRMRCVRHHPDAPVSLILLEASLGGNPGMKLENDLFLFDASGAESAESRRIYHHEEVT